jgi:ribose transport system substrate-binding protein
VSLLAKVNIESLTPVVAVLLLCGCNRPAAPSRPPEESPKGRAIGVSLANLDGPWRAQVKADIEASAAKHPELRLVLTDAKNDASKQQTQLDGFRESRVSLVIVSPKDAQALTEPVAKLLDAGIPVIVLNRPVIGDKYTCFIAADPRQIGAAAGKWLAERLRGKGNLVELRGPVDSQWATEMHDAWRAALREPGYHFVFDGQVDLPRVDGAKLMQEAFGRVKKIDAVFAYDDTTAYAAYRAAKTAGREKGPLWVGVGGLPTQGAAYVREGILAASFLNPTGGAEAIDATLKLLGGQPVPKKIVLPTQAITK